MQKPRRFPNNANTPPGTRRSRLLNHFYACSRLLIAYALLPNVAFWLGHRYIQMGNRGLFGLEYPVIGILGAFLPSWATIAMTATALLVDCLFVTAGAYYFTASEMLSCLRYATMLPLVPLSTIVAGVVAFALLLSCLVSRVASACRSWRTTVAVLLSFLVIVGTLDVAGGTSALSYRFPAVGGTWVLEVNTAGASSVTLLRAYYVIRFGSPRPPAPAKSALQPAVDLAVRMKRSVATSGLPNIVLVLFESYGLALDPWMARALEQPYRSQEIAKRYAVESGAVPFTGPTVPGELRELCGLGVDNHTSLSSDQLSNSAPAALRALGYSTTAVHGFTGVMYDRVVWYPKVGFQTSLFRRDLDAAGIPRCAGVFDGSCDIETAGFVGQMLARSEPGPIFIYWLTLDSHVPVPSGFQDRSIPGILTTDSPLDSWMASVHRVNSVIAQVAARLQSRPTIFVVVGDHPPGFISAKRRAMFDSRSVPFFRLIPKALLKTGR